MSKAANKNGMLVVYQGSATDISRPHGGNGEAIIAHINDIEPSNIQIHTEYIMIHIITINYTHICTLYSIASIVM